MAFKDEYKAAFPGPYAYHPEGGLIMDTEGNIVVEVRGWGRLIGEGDGGLGMNEGAAVILQDWFGEWLAETLNSKLS